MKNRLLVVGALALASLSLASAKTYDIILTQASKAGNVQLAPGEYHLKVEGSNAVFTNLDNNKHFTVPVKVQSADKKFDQTAVETDDTNGSSTVQAIELGGSTTKLGF
jgi:chemotaxis response regulator CheB